MNNSRRVRRVALLCLNCVSNIAGYRAGWIDTAGPRRLRVQRDFWVRLNGNFLDLAALEWCKLFAETDGKHHWSRVIDHKKAFRETLLKSLHVPATEFAVELRVIKKYRDKHVAHLDDPTQAEYPRTELMLRSALHLYQSLVSTAQSLGYLADAPIDASAFYENRLADALNELRLAESS